MIILASVSPRRCELLSLITKDFTVIPSDADESFPSGSDPRNLVETLSLLKAQAVFKTHEGNAVIGADTVVSLDGEILGKPRDENEAAAMLRKLSGKTHTVFTGVTILAKNISRTFCEAANVEFLPLTDQEIEAYIKTGEAFDKAGAYGIQGKGALFVPSIDGDFYTVMGLPVARLNRELKSLNLI